MRTLIGDIRFAVRMLLRNPGVTAVAVLALALGTGANSAIFSVVYAVLLRPLPVRDVDRLVTVAMVSEKLHVTGTQPGFSILREVAAGGVPRIDCGGGAGDGDVFRPGGHDGEVLAGERQLSADSWSGARAGAEFPGGRGPAGEGEGRAGVGQLLARPAQRGSQGVGQQREGGRAGVLGGGRAAGGVPDRRAAGGRLCADRA